MGIDVSFVDHAELSASFVYCISLNCMTFFPAQLFVRRLSREKKRDVAVRPPKHSGPSASFQECGKFIE